MLSQTVEECLQGVGGNGKKPGEGKARRGAGLSAEFGVLSAAVRCYYLMSSAPVKCNKIVHDKQFVRARLHLTYNTQSV